MSKAEELLDSLSIEDIQPFTSQPDIEGHIVIDKDRIIRVPTELKRIAVQYDANIETVTFDCPRYWDEHDLSEMNIYINYKLPGNLINNIGQSLAKNLRINEDDENIINFDWTIGPILTNNKGDLPFSVCAKSKTNQDSDEAIRWYTEINTELTISEGMDGSGDIEDNYEDLFPDIINDIITKLDGINATYDEKLDAFNANATSKTESFDTNAETRTTEFNNNAAQKTLDYNNNCTSKTDSFNQNSTQKVTEFNDNYTSKLNSFNSNADSRIEELDTHADLVLSSIPKQNIEGTNNVFDDGLESPLYDLAGDGKSEQVVTTGANLLNLDVDNNNQSYGGMTVIIDKDNQTVNFDGSLSDNPDGGFSSFNGQFPLKEPITIEAGTYDFFAKVIDGNGVVSGAKGRIRAIRLMGTDNKNYDISSNQNSIEINKASFTFEQPVTITTIQIIIYSNITLNNYKIGLYFGKQNVEYEPYTGGQPSPSPDYPQEINSIEGSLEFACRGKNLYELRDYDGTVIGMNLKIENQILTLDGTSNITWFSIGNSSNQSNIPRLKKDEDYTITFISTFDKDLKCTLWNDVDNVIIQSVQCNPVKANSKSSFTFKCSYDEILTNFRIAFAGFTVGEEVQGTMKIMIKEGIDEGIQATSYEPYIEPNEVTFNLNDEKLRSVGDVKDELVVDLDTGDYFKVENIGEVVFDGSDDEGWGRSGNTSETNFVGVLNGTYLTDFVKCKLGYGIYSIINYFTHSNNLSSKQGFQFYNDNGQYYTSLALSIDIDTVSTMEEFKQWLSTHNTIVDYVLQNPTTKKLGTLSSEDLAKLKTFKGYNNVTVNTNLGLMNIRFTYGLDIKKYVDNKIAELSAQLIKGE